MESGTDRIVRNLYGHKNDGFSNPKIAWSSNGQVRLILTVFNFWISLHPAHYFAATIHIINMQYLYGNSQEENCVCVWDIASSSIVKKLDGHSGLVRDIYSSFTSDTVATVSFDKSGKVWLREM
jgi:WD40 repeat protein